MTARLRENVKQYLKDNIGIIGALFILCIFLSVFPETSGPFLAQKNIFDVLRQISSNLFLACGMTMVIILGGVDSSVGSIIAPSGCFATGCVSRYGLPIAVDVLGGVPVGTVAGAFNSVVISKTTIPPFIVTLATMNVAKGLAYVYTDGSPVCVITKEQQFLRAGYVGGVPTPVILLAAVLIITTIAVNKTRLGRHTYMVDGSSRAARFSGISTTKVEFLAHTYSGIMTGFAGVALASHMYSGQPTTRDEAEMDTIAAVVMGGTSMVGGSGEIGGTITGGLTIGVLNNGLNLLSVNSFWQYMIKGTVIPLAIFVGYLRNKKAK